MYADKGRGTRLCTFRMSPSGPRCGRASQQIRHTGGSSSSSCTCADDVPGPPGPVVLLLSMNDPRRCATANAAFSCVSKKLTSPSPTYLRSICHPFCLGYTYIPTAPASLDLKLPTALLPNLPVFHIRKEPPQGMNINACHLCCRLKAAVRRPFLRSAHASCVHDIRRPAQGVAHCNQLQPCSRRRVNGVLVDWLVSNPGGSLVFVFFIYVKTRYPSLINVASQLRSIMILYPSDLGFASRPGWYDSQSGTSGKQDAPFFLGHGLCAPFPPPPLLRLTRLRLCRHGPYRAHPRSASSPAPAGCTS